MYSIRCDNMDLLKDKQKQLYEDALYYHLIHNGKKVIRNKYGIFWDKRKQILKVEEIQ